MTNSLDLSAVKGEGGLDACVSACLGACISWFLHDSQGSVCLESCVCVRIVRLQSYADFLPGNKLHLL